MHFLHFFPSFTSSSSPDIDGDSTDAGKVDVGSNGNGDADAGSNSGDEDNNDDIGILGTMLDNLDAFVLEPAPQGCVVKCRITRDRKGMDRGER